MKFKSVIDKTCEEEIKVTVHERTPLVDGIERLVLQESIADKIAGHDNDAIVMLDLCDIEVFYVENDKTYAHCNDKKRYLIKKKLHKLGDMVPEQFVRINKSAIANSYSLQRLW